MIEEQIKIEKIEDFSKVALLEQKRDGQWYITFTNGVLGKIDLIALLTNLLTKSNEEAIERFIEKAEFVKHIPAGHISIYENKTGGEIYLITLQSLDKGDKE